MKVEARHASLHGKELKILTPKQMLQIFPIVLAQVKEKKIIWKLNK